MSIEVQPKGARQGRAAATFLVGLGLGLIVLEMQRPRRPAVEGKLRHDLRNLAIGALGAAATAAPGALVRALTHRVENRRWGLLQRLPLPPAARLALGVVLMDYTLYHWHVMTHRAPWLWRTHLPHHADLDLTATTALRFHLAELLLSVPYRLAQVLVIGVGPGAFAVWQALTTASVLFHHANLSLAPRMERALRLVLVTPQLHEIHHSMKPAEMNANWSSGLSLWDRLHGTLVEAPGPIRIGLAGREDRALVTLPAVLALPVSYGRRPRQAVL